MKVRSVTIWLTVLLVQGLGFNGSYGTVHAKTAISNKRAVIVVVEPLLDDPVADTLMETLAVDTVREALITLAEGNAGDVIELVGVNATPENVIDILEGRTIRLDTNSGYEDRNIAGYKSADLFIMTHGSTNGPVLHGGRLLSKKDIQDTEFAVPLRFISTQACFSARWIDAFWQDSAGFPKTNRPVAVKATGSETNWIGIPIEQYFLAYLTGKGVDISKASSMFGHRFVQRVLDLLVNRGIMDKVSTVSMRNFNSAVRNSFESAREVMLRVYYYALLLEKADGLIALSGGASELQDCATATYPAFGCRNGQETAKELAFKRALYRIEISRPQVHLVTVPSAGLTGNGTMQNVSTGSIMGSYISDPTASVPAMIKIAPPTKALIDDSLTKAVEAWADLRACRKKHPWGDGRIRCADEFARAAFWDSAAIVELLTGAGSPD